MALLFASWWTELYFTIFLCFFLYYLHFKFVASQFWHSKNVFHLRPVFIFGNNFIQSFRKNFALILTDIYHKHKEHGAVGLWNFTSPILLVTDIELVKKVLTTDFSHFRDRGIDIDFKHDPLTENLFNVGGAKWRNLRVKLTPTFTSGKMKMMFPTMVECGEELQEYLRNVAEESEGVEVKEILARFTTDIISSCAFGIQTNSLKNPDSEFRKFGKKIFEPNLISIARGILFNFSPKLFKLLRFRFTPQDVTDFFLNVVRETMEYREKKQVSRKDFMELLIQLKNKGKIEDVDGVIPTTTEDDVGPAEESVFTFNSAAAQAFVFFAAGFETSSTTLTFALYELALNPEIQETLHKEINKDLQRHEGKMTYEGVNGLEYLDWVVQETLRKYPPVPLLFRQCNKDYNIPGMNAKIPKKTAVMIPVLGIQRDAEFFPEPDKFDPRRYSPEEKAKRHHFASLFFGEGPRNCIGNRFGLMQTKVGLVSILSKYRILTTKETPVPLIYDTWSFVLSSKSGMPLKFQLRN